MTNVPYKKIYRNGVLTNPINGFYPGKRFLFMDKDGNSVFTPNRSQRRRNVSPVNNRKITKGRQNRQFIKGINNLFKVIKHDIRFIATSIKRKKTK